MVGSGHEAEANSCYAFYGAQCSFVYVTGETFIVTLVNQ
jgi:hypothetical protein